jgi:hypothetical protein
LNVTILQSLLMRAVRAMIADLDVMREQLVVAYEIAQPAAMQLLARVQTARGSG